MRSLLLALLPTVLLLPAWSAESSPAGSILIVADKNVPAYREAADSLKKSLNPAAGAVSEIAPANLEAAMRSEGAPVRLAVAVGTDARAALAHLKVSMPVVSTMISVKDLETEAEPLSKPAGSVYVDLELPQVVAEVGRLFPEKKRIGLIINSRKAAPGAAMMNRFAQSGYQLKIAISQTRTGLLEALKELKGKVDLILCLPETGLFDSRTIPLLLRASLEDQLPVVGFSPSFVRAGAVAGVFADFADVGVQTAEMVQRILASRGGGAEGGDETPRRVASQTNPTVLRLLGWKAVHSETPPQ